jgi:hypothetical protein
VSDYRYQLVTHNGIDCVHVMIEVTEDTYDHDIQETHIPLDDILESATRQGFLSIPQDGEWTPEQIDDLARSWNIIRQMQGKPPQMVVTGEVMRQLRKMGLIDDIA